MCGDVHRRLNRTCSGVSGGDQAVPRLIHMQELETILNPFVIKINIVDIIVQIFHLSMLRIFLQPNGNCSVYVIKSQVASI